MCVKAEGFKFAHGFKIQVSLENSYRILLAENIKKNLINGCYGICLENGFFATSKEPKPLAMQQIIYDILNQSLNVEEFNRRKFPGKEISYAEAITGNISDKLNNYIKEREGDIKVDTSIEAPIEQYLSEKFKQKKMLKVFYVNTCHTDCTSYNSCEQKV